MFSTWNDKRELGTKTSWTGVLIYNICRWQQRWRFCASETVLVPYMYQWYHGILTHVGWRESSSLCPTPRTRVYIVAILCIIFRRKYHLILKLHSAKVSLCLLFLTDVNFFLESAGLFVANWLYFLKKIEN